MIKYFFLILLSSISIALLAQDEEVPAQLTWGAEYTKPSGSYLSRIITTDRNGFYTLRVKNKELSTSAAAAIYIEYYDKKTAQLLNSRKISLKFKNKKRDLEDVFVLDGKLYLLTSFNNIAKQKNYLFIESINKKTLDTEQNLQKIGEVEANNKVQEGKFDYYIPRDSMHILFYHQLPYKKNQPERFALRVFDKKMKEKWSKNIVLPYNDVDFTIEEYRIDRDGNVYLLGVLYGDKSKTRRRGLPTYQYVILAYSNNGESLHEYNINLHDKFITDLTFRIANNGHLICTGFYSEKGTYSIKGTYFFRLNAETKEIYNKNLKKFDFEFLTEDLSSNKKEKAKKAIQKGDTKRQPELYNYSLDDLILRNDGGALLIAEQYYIYERNYSDFGYYRSPYYTGYQRDYYYNYNNIIVVNINPNGEIAWATSIPKQQVTKNDNGYFSSYAMATVRDKIYFIYNDNRKNYEASKKNRVYNFDGKNSLIVLTELKKDGSTKTFPLSSNRDAAVVTRPKICKQIKLREMAIYGEWGKHYRFANLKFE